MTTQLTKNYWLDVFAGWVEARDMPGPQNDEAIKVISELKASEARTVIFEDAQKQSAKDHVNYEVKMTQKLESAEARAAQAEAERDEARRALEQAQERIKQLERETAYFQSTDFAADKRLAQVERTAPLDWRETETPLGQQLDGGGDEVES